MKKWSENKGFSGLNDELCMFFVSASSWEWSVVMPNVAEKQVLGLQKTLKFNEISVKKLQYSRNWSRIELFEL